MLPAAPGQSVGNTAVDNQSSVLTSRGAAAGSPYIPQPEVALKLVRTSRRLCPATLLRHAMRRRFSWPGLCKKRHSVGGDSRGPMAGF
jgi:hypothetical protein